MFVIDRVEIDISHQREQRRKLESRDPRWFQQDAEPFYKVVQVRNMCQYVIGRHQVRGKALRHHLSGGFGAEEGDARFNALAARGLRDAGGRLDAECRNVTLGEITQQIAVIAGDLDDATAVVQIEPRDHRSRIAPRVIEPATRIG